MKKRSYICGIRRTNFTNTHIVIASGRRKARWIYVNLYAPPCTRYSETAAYEE